MGLRGVGLFNLVEVAPFRFNALLNRVLDGGVVQPATVDLVLGERGSQAVYLILWQESTGTDCVNQLFHVLIVEVAKKLSCTLSLKLRTL